VPVTVEKSATGITGLDQITAGGLPARRTTLVTGGPGCGKTLLGLEYLIRGARNHDEPGVLVTFEEDLEDLLLDTAALELDLQGSLDEGRIAHRFVETDRDVTETGGFDLGSSGSGSRLRSRRSAPSASPSTPSMRCSRSSPTTGPCASSSAGSSADSTISASRSSSPRSETAMPSPDTASKRSSRTA